MALGDLPKRSSERWRSRAASISRSRGGALVTREARSFRAAAVVSSTARSKAASLAFDGLVKPLSFRTNWMADARISSSVTGGSKLKRVLMLRHMDQLRSGKNGGSMPNARRYTEAWAR